MVYFFLVLSRLFVVARSSFTLAANNLIAAKEEAKIISEMFNIPVYSDYDFE